LARLFFALWPDAAASAALSRLAAELAALSGGKAVPAGKIHLTLAFLGIVEDSRVAAAFDAAQAGRWRAFGMRVDTTGSFRGARVAWAGCASPVPGLASLQSGLARGLAHAGFALDERPFAPHLTLVRKIARPIVQSPIPAIEWRVAELALVRSELGKGTYATMGAWPLLNGD
jgi:2'-5' RNA ligase